jgi:hypothetical protein
VGFAAQRTLFTAAWPRRKASARCHVVVPPRLCETRNGG